MTKPLSKRSTSQANGGRREPAAADYSDEVTLDQLARLKQSVADLKLDQWEKVKGPAW